MFKPALWCDILFSMRLLRCWQRPVSNFTPTPRFPRSPLTGSGSHWRNRMKPSTRDISLWKTMGLGGCRGMGRGRKHLDHILTPTDPDPEPRRLSPDRDIMKWQFRDDWGFPNDRAPKGPKSAAPTCVPGLALTRLSLRLDLQPPRRLSKSCNLVSVHPAERGMHADNPWIGCVLCSVQNMWFTKNDVRHRIKCFCESTESCSSSLAEQGRERRGVMLTHQWYK